MADPVKPITWTAPAAIVLLRLGVLVILILLSLLLYLDVTSARVDSSGIYMLLHGLLFALFGATGIYIAKRCNAIRACEHATVETTAALLENLPAPLLLLSAGDVIVYANDPACAALNTTAQTLCAKRFSELCLIDGKPIPESFGCSAYLMRESMKPLPVSYKTREVLVPEAVLPDSEGGCDSQITVTLLLFNDITDAMKLIGQLQKVERITSATRMAGEMAHEIQVPLSTLSASVQLLRHYEEKATSADWLPNSPRRNDRRELFEHIEDASSRMNSVIRNFIDFAEFSPKDLLSIIKLDSIEENQGYIDHLNTIGRNFKDGQNSHSG